MKDYKDMAENVLKRRDKYIVERRKQMKRVVSVLSCFCLVALLGAGVWRSNWLLGNGPTQEQGALQTGTVLPGGAPVGNDTNKWDPADEVKRPAPAQEGSLTEADEYQYRTIISSYGDGVAAFSYDSPENGTFKFSIPLKGALDEYGVSDENGDILYRVLVYVFKDKNELDINSEAIRAESDRLFASGYTVTMEAYEDHGYFTLHATKEQLINFVMNEEYGYRFFLYDEFAMPESSSHSTTTDRPVTNNSGDTGALIAYDKVWGGSYMDQDGRWVILLTENTLENQQVVFNLNPTLSEDNATFKPATYTRAYLANLMEDLSRVELPACVSSIGLQEDLNRIVVYMTSEDADSIEKVLAFDSIGGAIEFQLLSGENIIPDTIKMPMS